MSLLTIDNLATPVANDPGRCPGVAKAKPHLTIEPSSGFAALRLKELWLYRDLLLMLAMRDVKLRYRQTALGVIWVVLQPLLGAFILGFVFGIPRRLLNEGTYRIELIASLHCRDWLLAPGQNAPSIFLTIQGGLSDSPYWMGRRNGIVAPVLPWEVVGAGSELKPVLSGGRV